MTKFLRFGFAAMAFFVALEAAGGNLRDFAEKATGTPSKSEKEKKPVAASDDIAHSAFGSGTYPSSGEESFLAGLWSWLVAAPFYYRYDDPSASMSPHGGEGANGRYSVFPLHELGEATAPYARFDYNWQYVDSDIDADDVRVEVGYKVLAFHARTTRYDDSSADEKLDINQYYGVLRYGGYRPDFLPGTFEFGAGFGAARLEFEDSIGTIKDTNFAWTIILKYYPVDWLGLEFRPAWYSFDERVSDYDLSASLGHRYVQLRGGYRWLETGGTRIDGPYAGVSVSF